MRKNRIIYLVVGVVVVLLYVLLPGWLSSTLLLLYVLLPGLSVLMSWPLARMSRLRLRVPSTAEMGETVQIRYEIAGWMPVLPGQSELRICHLQTDAEWPCTLPAELTGVHCGGFVCRLQRCRMYDYLGLFPLKMLHRVTAKIVVRPAPVPVKQIPELPRRLTTSWRSKPGGGFSENYELRPYRPGDPLRQIHWKTTAKTGKLIYRETMVPNRAMARLQLDLNGTPEELDRKLGRLRWMGENLLERDVPFDVQALTGNGLQTWQVSDGEGMLRMLDALLSCPGIRKGTVLDTSSEALWNMYIGGEPDEA